MLIYLVDDDQEDQEIFDMALFETGVEARLECFSCASTALESLRNSISKPDFVFLDLNMPKINGLECLKQLADGKLKEETRVIIYSTSSNQKDIEETKSLGAHEYLIKPVNFNSLVDSIRKLIA